MLSFLEFETLQEDGPTPKANPVVMILCAVVGGSAAIKLDSRSNNIKHQSHHAQADCGAEDEVQCGDVLDQG